MKIYKCRYGWMCATGTSDKLPNATYKEKRMSGQKYCHYIEGSEINPGAEGRMCCGWASDVGFDDLSEYVVEEVAARG